MVDDNMGLLMTISINSKSNISPIFFTIHVYCRVARCFMLSRILAVFRFARFFLAQKDDKNFFKFDHFNFCVNILKQFVKFCSCLLLCRVMPRNRIRHQRSRSNRIRNTDISYLSLVPSPTARYTVVSKTVVPSFC